MPVWIDLVAPDPGAAGRFYDAVFGGEELETASREVGVLYRIFSIDGRNVGGLTAVRGDFSGWRIYFSVPDAEHCVGVAQKRGATVTRPPFAIADHGTTAVL